MVNPSVSCWLRSLTAGSIIALMCLPAVADTPLPSSSTSEKKVFRFNVSPNGYPPYLINEENRTTGIMWEVVATISDRLGYRIEPMKIPRKRVDQLLLENMIDGTLRAKEWNKNPEDFLFTDPIVDIEEVVFFPRSSPHEFKRIEDLYSLTLVTHLGYHYPALRPHFESGRIERFDVQRDQDLFVYVLRGDEMDAAIADRLVGQWILLEQGMQSKFRASSEVLSRYGYRVMLRPGWQSFAKAFDRELASMRENGEIEAILSRYR